jgi:hypothetical protein
MYPDKTPIPNELEDSSCLSLHKIQDRVRYCWKDIYAVGSFLMEWVYTAMPSLVNNPTDILDPAMPWKLSIVQYPRLDLYRLLLRLFLRRYVSHIVGGKELVAYEFEVGPTYADNMAIR